MTKNNLKIVKTDDKKQKELKEKSKSLEAAISQIDQNFGKGSVMKLGQKAAMNIEAISTGSLSLDLALGIGGLPKGRVIEIYGPESSGKTTLALQVVAEAQKTGQNDPLLQFPFVEHPSLDWRSHAVEHDQPRGQPDHIQPAP